MNTWQSTGAHPHPHMTKNYHKIEQSAFYHLNGLKGSMDAAREALRELYPVGTKLEALLSEELHARTFWVIKASDDGYDAEKVGSLTIRDSQGDEYLLPWPNESHNYEIRVIARPPTNP